MRGQGQRRMQSVEQITGGPSVGRVHVTDSASPSKTVVDNDNRHHIHRVHHDATVHGANSTSTNRGAHSSRPPWRRPTRPGLPTNPEPCSGTTEIDATTSSPLPCTTGRASAATAEAQVEHTPSGAPQ